MYIYLYITILRTLYCSTNFIIPRRTRGEGREGRMGRRRETGDVAGRAGRLWCGMVLATRTGTYL